MGIKIKIANQVFTAELESNATADAFLDLLPRTFLMNEMGGNQKYHYLPASLPVDLYSPGTVNAGELLIYKNSCLVLFYKECQTTERYTRLGKVDNPEKLESLLGRGNVTVTFQE